MNSLHEFFCAASFLFGAIVALVRPFDMLRAFLAGMLIYFYPVLLGARDFVYGHAAPSEQTTIIVTLIVSITSLVSLAVPRLSPRTLEAVTGRKSASWGAFLSGLGVLLLLALIVRYGPVFFLMPRNNSPLSGLDKELLRIFSSFICIYGIASKQINAVAVGIALLIVTTLVGDRTSVTMTVGAWMLHQSALEDANLISFVLRRWPVFLFTLLFVVYGKLIYTLSPLLARGDFQNAGETYAKYTAKAPLLEPAVLFETLNKSIVSEFHIWPDELAGSAVRALPFSNFLGAGQGYSFNRLMQSQVFPAAKWDSMAYHPWAEGWSVAGLIGVGGVLAGFLSAIILLAKLFQNRGLIAQSVFLNAGAYLSLYSHRNTLGLSIYFTLQWILFAGALFVLWLLVDQTLRAVVDRSASQQLLMEQ
jgi:hypothetical protein